jgi:hypothetical protein
MSDELKFNLGEPKGEDFGKYKLELFPPFTKQKEGVKKDKRGSNLYKRQLRFMRRQISG